VSVAGIAIVAADLDDPRIAVLLDEHLAEMEPTAPACSRHALTAEQFRMPGVHLWVAERENDSAAPLFGSVALKDVSPGHLELKTMRVTASARGLGLGRRLLDHALEQARLLGATRVSLETGVVPAFDAARALYASAGFTPCEPFGAYRPDRHSVFLTREV
jgi:putative acetyltransferase